METLSERLKFARSAHGYTQDELAKRTGIGLATIRRIEQAEERWETQLGTIERLANALSVQPAWLAYGAEPMVRLGQMTAETQIAVQAGPGTEGLPGFCVIDGGVWEETPDGWQVNRRELMRR